MQIGSTEEIVLEDVTFHCKRARGPRRQYNAALVDLGYKDTMETDEKARIGNQIREISDKLIADVVTKVEGLFASNGDPLAWDPELLDELPNEIVEELGRRILQGNRPKDEAENASSESGKQPAVTIAGTE